VPRKLGETGGLILGCRSLGNPMIPRGGPMVFTWMKLMVEQLFRARRSVRIASEIGRMRPEACIRPREVDGISGVVSLDRMNRFGKKGDDR